LCFDACHPLGALGENLLGNDLSIEKNGLLAHGADSVSASAQPANGDRQSTRECVAQTSPQTASCIAITRWPREQILTPSGFEVIMPNQRQQVD